MKDLGAARSAEKGGTSLLKEEIGILNASRAKTSTGITIRRVRRSARGAPRANTTTKIRYPLNGMHKRIGSPPTTRTLTMPTTAPALARKASTKKMQYGVDARLALADYTKTMYGRNRAYFARVAATMTCHLLAPG